MLPSSPRKPTSRMVPSDQGDWGGIAVEFVVTRSARDQARFFDVLASGPTHPMRPLRIGLTTDSWGGGPLGPGIEAGLLQLGDVLDDAGHDVVPIAPPIDVTDIMRAWDPHFGRWIAHDVDRWAAAYNRPIDDTTIEPITRLQWEQVHATSLAQLSTDQLAADLALAAMDERLAHIDIVVSATNDIAALPLHDLSGLLPDMETYLAANDGYFSSLFPANVSGRPAMSVPMGQVGTARAGAQLMGRRGDDRILIELARQIETAGIATSPLV